MAAAQFYLDQGQMDEALSLARDLGKKDLIGYCLIVQARLEISIQDEGKASSDKQEDVQSKVKEAFELFKFLERSDCYKYGDSQNGAGEASLLLGQLTNDVSWIKLSWGAFNKSKPRNEAGQLQCMHWMMYNSDLKDRQNLFQVVKGMQNLYGVLRVVMLEKPEDKHRLDHIYRYYGLEMGVEKTLICNPQQKPRILEILKMQRYSVNEKLVKYGISAQDARFRIAQELLMKGKDWYNKLKKEFESQHRMLGVCPMYHIGVKGQCQTPCTKGHHLKLTKYHFNKLIDLDLLFMEMEGFVDDGYRAISPIPDALKKIQDSFYSWQENEYCSCKLLLSSIFLKFQHGEGSTISTNSEVFYLKKKLGERKHRYVQKQMERMLGSNYDKMRDKTNKIREKNTELFMNMIFLMNFFNINLPLTDILQRFEHELLMEFHKGMIVHRTLEELGFLRENDLVHCLFRRFMEAYEYLSSSNNNPEWALRQFSNFIHLEKRPNHEPMLPDLGLLTMWIEFYTVVAFCLECKFTTVKNISFVIPSSYLSVVNSVDSSFLGDKGVPTFEAINRYSPHHIPEVDLVRNRTERLVGILAGTDSKINIISLAFRRMSEAMMSFQPLGDIDEDQPTKKVFEYSEDVIDSIAVAERVLVAGLVFVCNMDETVYTYSETHVIGEICRIKLPDYCPERLTQAVQSVQKAKGIADIAQCLKTLLIQREENLLQCLWLPRNVRRHGIMPKTDIDMTVFQNVFFNKKTSEIVVNPDTVIESHINVDDDELTMSKEEKERIEADKRAYEVKEQKRKSAKTILMFFRHLRFLSNCENLRDLCEKEQLKEKQSSSGDIFSEVIVNGSMCGICGEYFKMEDRNNEKGHDMEDVQDDTEIPVLSQPASTTSQPIVSESSRNILHNMFSNVKGYMFKSETEPAIDQLHSQHFPSLAETKEKIQDGLTDLQKHERSMHHLKKQQDFIMFKNKFIREFKREVDDMKDFIEKYELKSARIKKLYPDVTLEIMHVTSAYDNVIQHVRKIIRTKNWRDNDLHVTVKEMTGRHLVIHEYVLDRYSRQSKVIIFNCSQTTLSRSRNLLFLFKLI